MPRFGGAGGPRPLDGQRMPSATLDYFKIAVNRIIPPKIIFEKTGLRRKTANELILKLADRLTQNSDGTWALPNLSEDELNLVNCVSASLVIKPAFDDERLYKDFVAALKTNGLITNAELSAIKDSLRTLVQLFAVSAMHNCVVQIGDGTTIQ
jgi:hypothetical protein